MIQKTTEQQNRWNARRLRQAFTVNAVFGMGKTYAAIDARRLLMLRYERMT